jgi:hypothetical protein
MWELADGLLMWESVDELLMWESVDGSAVDWAYTVFVFNTPSGSS